MRTAPIVGRLEKYHIAPANSQKPVLPEHGLDSLEFRNRTFRRLIALDRLGHGRARGLQLARERVRVANHEVRGARAAIAVVGTLSESLDRAAVRTFGEVQVGRTEPALRRELLVCRRERDGCLDRAVALGDNTTRSPAARKNPRRGQYARELSMREWIFGPRLPRAPQAA